MQKHALLMMWTVPDVELDIVCPSIRPLSSQSMSHKVRTNTFGPAILRLVWPGAASAGLVQTCPKPRALFHKQFSFKGGSEILACYHKAKKKWCFVSCYPTDPEKRTSLEKKNYFIFLQNVALDTTLFVTGNKTFLFFFFFLFFFGLISQLHVFLILVTFHDSYVSGSFYLDK